MREWCRPDDAGVMRRGRGCVFRRWSDGGGFGMKEWKRHECRCDGGVSRDGRRRVWRLTREDGEVLVRGLPEMLDCSGELEWCDHGGFRQRDEWRRRRRDGGAMKEMRWLVHGGAGGSGPSVVRDGGRGTRGKDEDVAVHWCSSGDGVSDEGATGDGFPAGPVVVGRGRGGCGVWRLRCVGAEEREEGD